MADIAASIDALLKRRGSPMAGMGRIFAAAGRKYGVDPRLVVSISGIESSFGKRPYGSYNAWGWGPGKAFGSWEEAIHTVTRGLAKGYISQGLRTPEQIVRKYAPGSDGNDEGNWAKVVSGFMRDLGGATPQITARSVPSALPPAAAVPMPTEGKRGAALGTLGQIAAGRKVKPTEMLADISAGIAMDREAAKQMQEMFAVHPPKESFGNVPTSAVVPVSGKWQEWVTLAATADRKGVRTNNAVLEFVSGIAQRAGRRVTIGTGTNHNRLTVNGNVSNHWNGMAADIPAAGAQLRELGYHALRAAGMSEVQARQAQRTGGLFNVGRYQVIFATQQGGNHFDHLHVGIR